MQQSQIPLSLYIHLPWCIRKCPYCDFNSHVSGQPLPKQKYILTLLNELKHLQEKFQEQRPLHSIFIGGGTPSLFSPAEINQLLTGINDYFPFPKNLEITLEANPGTLEHGRFKEYTQAGINRLSLGIQSLNDHHLKILGRIHSAKEAQTALEHALTADFASINCDLMYALPNQSVPQAIDDLNCLLSYPINHLSWYQLTIERNTYFHKNKPDNLPKDDLIETIEQAGYALLESHGFKRYEISAFAQPQQSCQHNLNYWQFGDYLGLGAGAHSKLTLQNDKLCPPTIVRFNNFRHPQKYLARTNTYFSQKKEISRKDLIYEFMLNACRLTQGFHSDLLQNHTGIGIKVIQPQLTQAIQQGLITQTHDYIQPTPLGIRFHNDLVNLFTSIDFN